MSAKISVNNMHTRLTLLTSQYTIVFTFYFYDHFRKTLSRSNCFCRAGSVGECTSKEEQREVYSRLRRDAVQSKTTLHSNLLSPQSRHLSSPTAKMEGSLETSTRMQVTYQESHLHKTQQLKFQI
jgi:hypothetical protein